MPLPQAIADKLPHLTFGEKLALVILAPVLVALITALAEYEVVQLGELKRKREGAASNS